VLETFDWDEPKTKQAVALLDAIGVGGKVLFVVSRTDRIAQRSLRNLPTVNVLVADQLSTYDILWADTVVFTAATIGTAGGGAAFEVAGDDFVREDDGGDDS